MRLHWSFLHALECEKLGWMSSADIKQSPQEDVISLGNKTWEDSQGGKMYKVWHELEGVKMVFFIRMHVLTCSFSPTMSLLQ